MHRVNPSGPQCSGTTHGPPRMRPLWSTRSEEPPTGRPASAWCPWLRSPLRNGPGSAVRNRTSRPRPERSGCPTTTSRSGSAASAPPIVATRREPAGGPRRRAHMHPMSSGFRRWSCRLNSCLASSVRPRRRVQSPRPPQPRPDWRSGRSSARAQATTWAPHSDSASSPGRRF